MRLVSLGIDGPMTAAMCGHEPRHIGGPGGLGGPLMTLPGSVKHAECAGGQPSKKIWEEFWLMEDLSQAALTQ